MTRKALIVAIQQFILNNVWILKCLKSTIPHFQKALKCFLKVTDCTQQLQVRETMVGFEKALGAVKVIKDQIQYKSQSLLNLARDLTPPQSRCSYSILHLKLFNIFTKNITKRSSETAKLQQENGGQYGYRHIKAQKYFQSWVSNHCS